MIRDGVEIVGSGGNDKDSENVLVSAGVDRNSEGGAPKSKRHKLSSWLKETTHIVSTLVTPQTTEQG